jgi:hypothetical protein
MLALGPLLDTPQPASDLSSDLSVMRISFAAIACNVGYGTVVISELIGCGEGAIS